TAVHSTKCYAQVGSNSVPTRQRHAWQQHKRLRWVLLGNHRQQRFCIYFVRNAQTLLLRTNELCKQLIGIGFITEKSIDDNLAIAYGIDKPNGSTAAAHSMQWPS